MAHDRRWTPLFRHHRQASEWGAELMRAAEGSSEERRRTSEAFLAYFYGQALGAIREDEATLLPLLGRDESGDVQRALRGHEALSVSARRLGDALAHGAPDGALLRGTGRLIRDHLSHRERALDRAPAPLLASPEHETPVRVPLAARSRPDVRLVS
jgi:hypothetical protein